MFTALIRPINVQLPSIVVLLLLQLLAAIKLSSQARGAW